MQHLKTTTMPETVGAQGMIKKEVGLDLKDSRQF